MKKFVSAALWFFALTVAFASPVYAKTGDMGFFGGISEGTRLPKTTEIILAKNANATTNSQMAYKEMIFLTGTPMEFSGIISVRATGDVDSKGDSGSYKVTYTVKPGDSPQKEISIDRTITYNVNWRREGSQVVKDYTVASWKETVTAGGAKLELDPKLSKFDISILEDRTAGVTYYKGDVSQLAVYKGDDPLTHSVSGSIYGYDSPWSNTETHRLNGQVYNSNWQMSYQVRPSVSVGKTLQYSPNEPTAISFPGNYREVMENRSGLQYNLTVVPRQFYTVPRAGEASIASYNAFEQLIAPDVSYLKGNFAEEDIKKLFAMEILSGDSNFYRPNQAITRSEFVTMLVKAIKLPVNLTPPAQTARGKKAVTLNIVFPDVLPERPDYPYIMACYDAGLAIGRGNGHFYADYSIEREEAITIMNRALGLTGLGLEPTPITPYADDKDISSWAKKDIYAATRIGLISGDGSGKINPKAYISKAEAAALVNSMIEYMRTGLMKDYAEHIVNYME